MKKFTLVFMLLFISSLYSTHERKPVRHDSTPYPSEQEQVISEPLIMKRDKETRRIIRSEEKETVQIPHWRVICIAFFSSCC